MRKDLQHRLLDRSTAAARGLPAEKIGPLTDYACALNVAYFCGDLREIPQLDPDGSLLSAWKESGAFFGSYFASLEGEIGKDHTCWEKLEDTE